MLRCVGVDAADLPGGAVRNGLRRRSTGGVQRDGVRVRRDGRGQDAHDDRPQRRCGGRSEQRRAGHHVPGVEGLVWGG